MDDANAPALILSQDEANQRLLQLAQLQTALAAHGVHGVLARTHRLVLQYNDPCARSGLTNPQLHIFSHAGNGLATTDGIAYTLASGLQYPASDPHAAAAAIARHHQSQTHQMG